MSQGENRPDDPLHEPAMSPDDALPPVEPPSAGFIIKLFVVPAAIVVVVLAVVFGFNWLAQRGGDADSYVQAIENAAPNSWQCAHSLANLLSTDPSLRTKADLATRLSNMLVARLKSGPPLRKPQWGDKDDDKNLGREAALRLYLCTALGHFAVPEALPGMLETARLTCNEEDEVLRKDQIHIRLAALEALAVYADNAKQLGPPLTSAEPVQVLLAASREPGADHHAKFRERAAYALGVFGGPEAVSRLEEMLSSELRSANVRFNAAIGLARHGNVKSIEFLAQMIDPDETAGIDEEPDERYRAQKELAVRLSGLSAAEQLAQANPQADLRALAAPLDKLRQREGVHPTLRGKALELLNIIRARGRDGE